MTERPGQEGSPTLVPSPPDVSRRELMNLTFCQDSEGLYLQHFLSGQ